MTLVYVMMRTEPQRPTHETHQTAEIVFANHIWFTQPTAASSSGETDTTGKEGEQTGKEGKKKGTKKSGDSGKTLTKGKKKGQEEHKGKTTGKKNKFKKVSAIHKARGIFSIEMDFEGIRKHHI